MGRDEVAHEPGYFVQVGGYHIDAGVVQVEAGSGSARVGEVDTAVGLDYDIVGTVESGAAIPVGYRGYLAVGVLACDAARAMFAGQQPAFQVAGESVGVVGGLLEEGDALIGRPFHAPVVVDVAEQQVAAIAPPEWAFGWASVASEAGTEFLYLLVNGKQAVEVWG